MASSDSSGDTVIDTDIGEMATKEDFDQLSKIITQQNIELNTKFEKMFSFLTKTTKQVEENKSNILQLQKGASVLVTNIQDTKQRISNLEDADQTGQLLANQRFLKYETEQKLLTLKIESLEVANRKLHEHSSCNEDELMYSSFLLEGLPEKGIQENPREAVLYILRRLDPKADNNLLDYAFRQNSNRYPRPIRFAFVRKSDADYTIKNKHRLNFNLKSNERPVFINQITSIKTMHQRNDLRMVVKAAYDANLQMTYRGDHVIYEGKRYFHKDIDTLPPRIYLMACKTRVTESAIGFRSPKSPLSNLFPCSLRIDNIEFNSVEQALQYHRALLLKDLKTASRILAEEDPFKIMMLAKHLKGSTWDNHKSDMLYSILREKFEQNATLANYLLITDQRHLVECTLDREWGAGITLFSRELDALQFPGKNMTGYALMQIRSDLKRSPPNSTAKTQLGMTIALDANVKALISELKRTNTTSINKPSRSTSIVYKSIIFPIDQQIKKATGPNNPQIIVAGPPQTNIAPVQSSSIPILTTNTTSITQDIQAQQEIQLVNRTLLAKEKEVQSSVTTEDDLKNSACAIFPDSDNETYTQNKVTLVTSVAKSSQSTDSRLKKKTGGKKSRRASLKVGRHMVRQSISTPNTTRNLDPEMVFNLFKQQTTLKSKTLQEVNEQCDREDNYDDDDIHLSQTPLEQMRRQQRDEHQLEMSRQHQMLNLQYKSLNGPPLPNEMSVAITTRSKSVN